MTLAHVGGVPLEELLALAPMASMLWLKLRARSGAVESTHAPGHAGTPCPR
jgi:hypothetical protein